MKKICIVADVKGWAFDSIAKVIKKNLENKYIIDIRYFNRREEKDNFYEFIESLKDYDLVHFLNRRILLLMKDLVFKEKVLKSGKDLEEYISSNKKRFTTAIYDYMDISGDSIDNYKDIFNKFTKMYYTCTKKLFEIYSKISEFNNPTKTIYDICDTDMYRPKNLNRFDFDNISNRSIVIGWAGNSKHSGENFDLKGFNTIIKPVYESLKKDGYDIKGDFKDRCEKWLNPLDMPKYYDNIDIYICASAHEGTPRTVLESMHSGVPIISTPVGIVPESFGTLEKNFIISSRDNGLNDEKVKKDLKEKLIYLYNHRELFKELSKENLDSINKFDGGKTIKKFDEFFTLALKEE